MFSVEAPRRVGLKHFCKESWWTGAYLTWGRDGFSGSDLFSVYGGVRKKTELGFSQQCVAGGGDKTVKSQNKRGSDHNPAIPFWHGEWLGSRSGCPELLCGVYNLCLETFKAQQDRALSNLIWAHSWACCNREVGFRPPELPSSLGDVVILWYSAVIDKVIIIMCYFHCWEKKSDFDGLCYSFCITVASRQDNKADLPFACYVTMETLKQQILCFLTHGLSFAGSQSVQKF